MTYRNRSLLDLAKGAPCFAAVKYVCNHNPETTVAMHADAAVLGKAMKLKAPDWAIAFGCSNCHHFLTTLEWQGMRISRETAWTWWLQAFKRTQDYLWEGGFIVLAPKQAVLRGVV